MKLLLTCGMGDLFAILDVMYPHEKESIKGFYLATPVHAQVKQVLDVMFPGVPCTVLIDKITTNERKRCKEYDFDRMANFIGDFWCFYEREQIVRFLKWRGQPVDFLKDVEDFGIYRVGGEYRKGRRYSFEWWRKDLKLPPNKAKGEYGVIHPHSTNAPACWRDFTPSEENEVIEYLKTTQQKAVVVNKSPQKFKVSPHIIDLTNNLTIPECLSVIRGAKFFIGAASAWSVAFTLMCNGPIVVKGKEHIYPWAHLYYHPHGKEIVYPQITRQVLEAGLK